MMPRPIHPVRANSLFLVIFDGHRALAASAARRIPELQDMLGGSPPPTDTAVRGISEPQEKVGGSPPARESILRGISKVKELVGVEATLTSSSDRFIRVLQGLLTGPTPPQNPIE